VKIKIMTCCWIKKGQISLLLNASDINNVILGPCHSLGAESWVQSQVRSHGIYDGKTSIGASYLQVLQLPLPVIIPPTAPSSLIITYAT
jgi:hypothetical protein